MTELNHIERSRSYYFPNGTVATFYDVTHFEARPSGTHRLKTVDGMFYIVSDGWTYIAIDTDAFTL